MSNPRIPIEVDTPGVDRALQHIEQRTKPTWRAINEGAPGGGDGARKSVAGSVITLRDEKGNQLYEPIVQTYFGAPRPAGG